MEVKMNREKIANDYDVKNMINDVSNVLSKHLISIIGKCKGDTEEMEKYILSIPFVSKINNENIELKKQLLVKENKIIFLNNNLSSLSQKYTELFLRSNKLRVSASLNSDKIVDNQEILNECKNNIELEVKDSICNNTEIDERMIEKDVEESLEEKRRDRCGFELPEVETMTGLDLNSDLSRFNGLNDEESDIEDAEEDDADDAEEDDADDAEEDDADDAEEDDAEDDDDADDADDTDDADDADDAEEEDADDADDAEEEDAGNSYAKTILNAQKAGEYATIDTASEEEDDEEVVEFEYNGVKYFASESKTGEIYEYLEDDNGEGDIGEIVGNYVNSEPIIF